METVVKSWVMTGPGQLELTDYPYPELKEDGVIVRVGATGICGTDKHMYSGEGGASNFPLIPGHEIVGLIEEVGPDALSKMQVVGSKDLKKGDRVVVAPGTRNCGNCYWCNSVPSRPQLCPNRIIYGLCSCKQPPHILGGFSQYLYALPRTWFFKVPDNVKTEVAAMTEPAAVALRAVERAYMPGEPSMGNGLGVGRTVLVIGAGPIGLLVTAVLKHIGAGLIIVTDRIVKRLELAKEVGADLTLDGKLSMEERKQIIFDHNNGVGPDVVIEAAGVPKAFEEGLDFVRPGGVLVECGHYVDTGVAEVHPSTICIKDVDIRGSWAYAPIIFRDALSFFSKTLVPVAKIVTHVLDFAKAEEGLKLVGGADVAKVVLKSC